MRPAFAAGVVVVALLLGTWPGALVVVAVLGAVVALELAEARAARAREVSESALVDLERVGEDLEKLTESVENLRQRVVTVENRTRPQPSTPR